MLTCYIIMSSYIIFYYVIQSYIVAADPLELRLMSDTRQDCPTYSRVSLSGANRSCFRTLSSGKPYEIFITEDFRYPSIH